MSSYIGIFEHQSIIDMLDGKGAIGTRRDNKIIAQRLGKRLTRSIHRRAERKLFEALSTLTPMCDVA